MVSQLVDQLLGCPEVRQVIVTCNLPERLALSGDDRVELVTNARVRGFGENHNAAFNLSTQSWFAIINPDVTLIDNPFGPLLEAARKSGPGIYAPLALSPDGRIEDNWRKFPTARSLILKALGRSDGRYGEYPGEASPFEIDWAAGLFLLCNRELFDRLGGFDSNYFLYYEDVDFCFRAWEHRFSVWACPEARVIHAAKRKSRRSLKHMAWHLASMFRFLGTHKGLN